MENVKSLDTYKNRILSFIFLVMVLMIWEISVKLMSIPAFVLPAPTAIGKALWQGLASALYWEHLKVTMVELLMGYGMTPITADYRGWTVHECPPSGQGVIALMILKILARLKPRQDPLNIDNLHVEVEATRLAYAARDAYLADPAQARSAEEFLLSDELADRLAAKINLQQAIATP